MKYFDINIEALEKSRKFEELKKLEAKKYEQFLLDLEVCIKNGFCPKCGKRNLQLISSKNLVFCPDCNFETDW